MDESEKYLKEAIQICEEEGLDFRQAQLWVNLGVLEFSRQNVGLSIDYNQRALSLFQSLGDKQNAAQCFQNIGFAHASMKNKEASYQYYEQAIELREEIGDKPGIARVLLNKGRLESELGQRVSAISFGQEAMDLLEGSENARLLKDIYGFMSTAYEVQNRYDMALEFQKKYSALKDSLQATINETKIAELTAQFEFDKQERALEVMNKEGELLKIRQEILTYATIALIVIIVILVFAARQRIARQRLEKEMAIDKARISQLHEEKLSQQLAMRDIELNSYADQLKQKNQVIADFRSELENLKTKEQKWLIEYGLKNLSEGIDRRKDGGLSWEDFRLKFDAVHTDYIRNLVSTHSGLTKNEIDLCILMKINLAHKDISYVLNVEYDSVKKSIQRLFRKLGFSSSDELRAYLMRF